MNDFAAGCKKGLPIALGYFPVSFSFGIMVASSGLPLGLATLISLTNLTSSGQFAGVSLILSQASYFEIALTLLMINARYFLMSLSLSQKIDQKMNTLQRLIVSFGITDEIFSLAALEKGKLSFKFMLGLIIVPVIGWTSGSFVGEILTDFLSTDLQNAMGICLYAMFLAILVPPTAKFKAVREVVFISALLSVGLSYLPLFNFLSSGMKLIASTMLAALYGAVRYPVGEASL